VSAEGSSRTFWLVGVGEMSRRVMLSVHRPVLVGRAVHNHLVLNDYRISRQHARITFERDSFIVYDLNSANGTLVNGKPVGREPLRITENDHVQFGPHVFQVASTSGRADSIPASLMTTRKTIPPEGTGSLDEERTIFVHQDDIPSPRSHFRTDPGIVDLNTLELAYNNLNTLYAFMQGIIKTIDRRALLELIVHKALDIFPEANSVAVYLPATPLGTALAARSPTFQLAQYSGDVQNVPSALSPSAVSSALAARRAIFHDDAERLTLSGSVMHAALTDREQALGILHIGAPRNGNGFSPSDLELLDGICVPSSIMLQNARMHEESLNRRRMNRDLELAAQIQKSFLPRDVLTVRDVEFLATYRAAYMVGGDFYDMFWVAPDTLAVLIGDISGKGISAALLMARLSGELRVAAHVHVDPEKVLSEMNKAIVSRGAHETFFTAVYYTYNVRTGEVHLASAGHPAPCIRRANGTVEVISDGASGAVGMLAEMQFSSTRFTLADGDSLVLYTDGITEAAARDGSLYGDDRLDACLRAAGPRPKDISDALLRSVGEHAAGIPASDDITIFVCQRRLGAPPSLQPKRSNTMPLMRPVGIWDSE
jgi:serine phosphatase RsbU (regulator of sigma subunit)/pSer/pThr/pTyr-binding forkhead associated (FHA) protein